jgi:DNA-binding CsgD family transcriptional regulator
MWNFIMNTYNQFNNFEELSLGRLGRGVQLLNESHAQIPQSNTIKLIDMLNMPFHAYFLNSQSQAQIANNALMKTFNLASHSDLIGLTAWDITTKKNAATAISHDNLVLNSKQLLIKDELYVAPDGIELPLLAFKFPWYDAGGRLVGVFGASVGVQINNLAMLANCISTLVQIELLSAKECPKKILPGLMLDAMYFTRREKDIISLLIRGKTAREIGLILDRSRRTIESHIENLKIKTQSENKSQLIEKCLHYME